MCPLGLINFDCNLCECLEEGECRLEPVDKERWEE